MNHLDPKLKIDCWTKEEDKLIIQSQKEYGNHWSLISNLLEGRTSSAIKNHWYSTLRRKVEKFVIVRKRNYIPKEKENVEKIKKSKKVEKMDKVESKKVVEENGQKDEIFELENYLSPRDCLIDSEIEFEDESYFD